MMDIRDAARIALAFWDGQTAPRGAKGITGIGGAMEHLRTALKHTKPLSEEEMDRAWQEIYRRLAKQHTTSMDWVKAGIEYSEKVQGLRK